MSSMNNIYQRDRPVNSLQPQVCYESTHVFQLDPCYRRSVIMDSRRLSLMCAAAFAPPITAVMPSLVNVSLPFKEQPTETTTVLMEFAFAPSPFQWSAHSYLLVFADVFWMSILKAFWQVLEYKPSSNPWPQQLWLLRLRRELIAKFPLNNLPFSFFLDANGPKLGLVFYFQTRGTGLKPTNLGTAWYKCSQNTPRWLAEATPFDLEWISWKKHFLVANAAIFKVRCTNFWWFLALFCPKLRLGSTHWYRVLC